MHELGKACVHEGGFMTFQLLGRSVFIGVAFVLMTLCAFAQVPLSQHVILVIDENTSFSDVMANMPWLISEGNANGYANNYHSDSSGSLMNYLWLPPRRFPSPPHTTPPSGTPNFNFN